MAAADDRRTKAELVEALERREKQIAEVEARAKREAEQLDPEAAAIAGCVRALDQLPKVRMSHSLRDEKQTNTSAVERVLSFLARRYGLRDALAELDVAQRREEEAWAAHERAVRELSELREALHSVGGR